MWKSEEAARQLFPDALVEQVTGLSGVRPSVECIEVVGIVGIVDDT